MDDEINSENGNNVTCSKDILINRTENDLTEDVKDIINTVTYHMNTLPVGTFKYQIFKYPGDVDLFENIETCCDFNVSKLRAASIIQSIVKDIEKNDNLIFSDFKAGYDNRYKIYTGVIGDDIIDYNPTLIKRDLLNLYEGNLLEREEYLKLISLVKDIPDLELLISLNEYLREYWIIRWNVREILDGYKTLRGNYKLYLDVALTQGSIVKIDVYAKTTDRYVEVTNFFLITQKDKFGNKHYLSEELGDYSQSLLNDIYKYYQINTLKSIKRLWMYLVFKNKICEAGIFTPLFSSDISLYSQIMSDVDVAINLLSGNLEYDKDFLFSSINNRISKINNNLCYNLDYVQPDYYNSSVIINNLKLLRDCMLNNVNNLTKDWLVNENIDIFSLI